MRNVFSYLRILCLSVFVLSSNLEPARADGNLGIHSAKQATQWRSIESLSITHFNNLSKIDVRLLDPSIRQELEALQWEKSPLRILERERSISEKAQLNFYQKAIEAGVIDPTLTDSTSLDELNKAYHIKRIYALLGSNGRGCLTCIPSPGYPDPMPVNDPIETFPLNLYPLMLRPRATKGAFSNLPGSFSKIGRVNQPFNPVGFTDVVQIFRGKDPLCTGTLVTENRVLTAAHCARPNEHETLTVHVPVESQEALLRCRTAMEIDKRYTEPCVAFIEVRVLRILRHTEYRPEKENLSPANDVEILVLDTKIARSGWEKITLKNRQTNSITVAGYGITTAPDEDRRHLIEVGWNSNTRWRENRQEFYYDPNKAESGACEGDSGGPVFENVVTGYEKIPTHSLVAVISAGFDKSRNKHCSEPYWITTTSLADSAVKDWLCKDAGVISRFKQDYCLQ